MAQIIYQIVTGTPNFTASIVPADAADQIQTAPGVYSFDDLPGDNYTLTVVDSLGCISVINNIVPITTTTSTTSEPTTTTTTTEFICNNILLNSGFESWTGGNPNNWTNVGGVQEDTIIHSGIHSVLLNGGTMAYQAFTATNTQLTLDLWYNTESDNCAVYCVIRVSDFAYLQGDGSWSGSVYTFILDNTLGEWVNNILPFNTDIGTSYYILLQDNGCAVYFDDVRICDSSENFSTTTTTTTTMTPTTTTTTTDGSFNFNLFLVVINDPEDDALTVPDIHYRQTIPYRVFNCYGNGDKITLSDTGLSFWGKVVYNSIQNGCNPDYEAVVAICGDAEANYVPTDKVFDPGIGNKLHYLITNIEYTSADIETLKTLMNNIPDLYYIDNSPSDDEWRGDYTFSPNLSDDINLYMIWDYRGQTPTTTTTTEVPTTTTTTTTSA